MSGVAGRGYGGTMCTKPIVEDCGLYSQILSNPLNVYKIVAAVSTTDLTEDEVKELMKKYLGVDGVFLNGVTLKPPSKVSKEFIKVLTDIANSIIELKNEKEMIFKLENYEYMLKDVENYIEVIGQLIAVVIFVVVVITKVIDPR